MKLLIAYDGSKSADAALGDLQHAGLPDRGVEALILTVAEIWMPPPENGNGPNEFFSAVDPDLAEKHQKMKKSALHEAESLCRHARESLQKKFPGWKISFYPTCGSPARKILEKAREFRPDLIVTGAQGNTAISRLFLGSIAGKIISEANCSVRVARRKDESDEFLPQRLIIGFDGSPGAQSAIEAVASRKWSRATEVRLVTAIDRLVPENIGRFMTASIVWVEAEMQHEQRWIEKIARRALLKLEAAGLKTELCVKDENPKQILIEEARKWNADCIFVGANSYLNESEQSAVGSVSAAVAERAPCSVEVVRNA
jgi:nucleotide-binding universal stress UspA family protein